MRNGGSDRREEGAADGGVSLLIPVHNRVELTRACLESVFRHTDPSLIAEIIVVDDCSEDETPAYLRSLGDRIRVMRNEVRGCFGENMNRAAEAARSNLLLLLNNDTIVVPGWLTPLIATAHSHPNAAVIGNCQLYADSGLINHAGVVFDAEGNPVHLYDGKPDGLPPARLVRQFQAVTGACWLLRRNAFLELGGFDPRFRNGFEDIDFCLRAKGRGYEIWYAGTSAIYHHVGSSAGRFRHEDANAAFFAERWGGRVVLDRAAILMADEALGPLHKFCRLVVRSPAVQPAWHYVLKAPAVVAVADAGARLLRLLRL